VTALNLRALQPADADAARALLSAQFSGSRYEARMLEQLEIAARDDDPECRALVAIGPDEGAVRGLALFGVVAGAQGIVKLHALAAPDRELLRALAGAVRDVSVRSGTRMIVCELPDDAPFRAMKEEIRELGLLEEGRVADFVCDGVDLVVLVWRGGVSADVTSLRSPDP
jgi:hypothetical protein